MDQQSKEKTLQQKQQECLDLVRELREEIRKFQEKFQEMLPDLQEFVKELNESPDIELTKEQEEEFNKKLFETVRGFDDNPVE